MANTPHASRPNGDFDTDLLRGAMQAEGDAMTIALALKTQIFPQFTHVFRDDDLSMLRAILAAMQEQLQRHFERATGETLPDNLLGNEIFAHANILSVIFARLVEARIANNYSKISQSDPDLPPMLQTALDNDDSRVIETAMQLLASQSRFSSQMRNHRLDLQELPAELLATLIGRVVSHIQRHNASATGAIRLKAAAQQILLGFKESNSRQGRLAKFLHFTAPIERVDESHDPSNAAVVPLPVLDEAGPALAFAILADRAGLDRAVLFLMAAEHGLCRLIIVLRATGFTSDQASVFLANIADMASTMLSPHFNAKTFDKIDRAVASDMVARWSHSPFFSIYPDEDIVRWVP